MDQVTVLETAGGTAYCTREVAMMELCSLAKSGAHSTKDARKAAMEVSELWKSLGYAAELRQMS